MFLPDLLFSATSVNALIAAVRCSGIAKSLPASACLVAALTGMLRSRRNLFKSVPTRGARVCSPGSCPVSTSPCLASSAGARLRIISASAATSAAITSAVGRGKFKASPALFLASA